MSTKCPLLNASATQRMLRVCYPDRPKVTDLMINYKYLYNGALPMAKSMFMGSKHSIEYCVGHIFKIFRMNDEEKKLFEWEFNYIVNELLISGDIRV